MTLKLGIIGCGGMGLRHMHGISELPLAKEKEKMSSTLLTMTKKSFGCVGVINKSNNLIGIITDGDLRRNMDKNIICTLTLYLVQLIL